MKKLFLSLSLLLTVISGTAFANDNASVTEKVQAAFKKEFPAASLIEWNNEQEFSKATFMLWGYRTQAYFTQEGQLLGSMRSLFYSQLPLAVISSVDKRFPAADVLAISEINNAEGTTYQLMIEQEGKKYSVKATSGGGISEVRKVKKNG